MTNPLFSAQNICEHLNYIFFTWVSIGVKVYQFQGGVATHSITCRISAQRWGGDGFDSRYIAKDVKSWIYYCYVRCPTLIVWVGDMLLPKTGSTHYHAQQRFPDNGRAMKGLIVSK